MTLMSFVQPLLSGYDPAKAPNINRPETWYLKPSADHWFGTDDRGNDMWDVVWAGTRMSLSIAFIAAAIYQETSGLINTETVLSYLGIGLPTTYPALGRMTDSYWSFVDTYPHMIVFPGIVLGLITISFYIVGQLFADRIAVILRVS